MLQYWCWVGGRWKGQRIVGEYLWLWLTLLVSICVYVPMFLWIAGNLVVYQKPRWKFRLHLRARDPESDDEDGSLKPPSMPSLALLAYVIFPRYFSAKFNLRTKHSYPVAYSIVVLPISIIRWIEFVQEQNGGADKVPSGWTFAAAFLHDMFGAVNVLLLLTTRPNLLLFEDPEGAGAIAPRLRNRIEVERDGAGALGKEDRQARRIRKRDQKVGRAPTAPDSPERQANGSSAGRLNASEDDRDHEPHYEELSRVSHDGSTSGGDRSRRRADVMELGQLNGSDESL